MARVVAVGQGQQAGLHRGRGVLVHLALHLLARRFFHALAFAAARAEAAPQLAQVLLHRHAGNQGLYLCGQGGAFLDRTLQVQPWGLPGGQAQGGWCGPVTQACQHGPGLAFVHGRVGRATQGQGGQQCQ